MSGICRIGPAGAEPAAVSPRKRAFAASGPPKNDRFSREGQIPQQTPKKNLQIRGSLGRVLISFDPEADAGKGDCGEEVSCKLVMAGRDASEVLELVEEAFDEIALAVQVIGHRALLPAVPLGRDVAARAMVGNAFEDGAGVAAAVGDGVPGQLKAVKEGGHGSLVGGLARGEREAARQAKAVDDDMDFGAQPAKRASDGVVRTPFFPPTACRCAGCERSR